MKKFVRKYARKNSLRATFVDVKDDQCTLFFSHDGGKTTDLALLDNIFSSPRYGYKGSLGDSDPSFALSLIERGYDITTLDFKIDKLDTNDIQRVHLNEQLKNKLSRY